MKGQKGINRTQLAAQYGVSQEQLDQRTAWAETPSMVAKRSRANVEAASVLAAATAEERPITDDDVLRVLRLWAIKENRTRTGVIPQGKPFVLSETMGLLNCQGGRLIATLHVKQYPKML